MMKILALLLCLVPGLAFQPSQPAARPAPSRRDIMSGFGVAAAGLLAPGAALAYGEPPPTFDRRKTQMTNWNKNVPSNNVGGDGEGINAFMQWENGKFVEKWDRVSDLRSLQGSYESLGEFKSDHKQAIRQGAQRLIS